MLEATLQLGEPVAHRGVVLAPLFPRRSPAAEYVTLEDALPLGLRIDEVSESGSVPQLAVANPTDANVLLYDGEELVGAKQNRILNVTVLVAAKSTTPIPVSCVEEGRWSRRSAHFAAAAHTAHPDLRRRKAQTLAAEPMALGLAQSEVWDEVRAKSARLGVHSPTGAQADVFRSREHELRELERAFPLQPGQCGAVLALGDDLCLDYVSRPDAFAPLPQAARRVSARRARAAGRETGGAGTAGGVRLDGRDGDAGAPPVRGARPGRPPGGRGCRRLGPGARR